MVQHLDYRLKKLIPCKGVFRVYALVAVACIFFLVACGGNPPAKSAVSQIKRGGTLQVGLIAEPTVLDPLTSVTLYDSDITANMYEGLFKYDTNTQLHPWLVSTYSYASPLVLNLTLRTGIKFQDGTPFNADAVVFNISRFLNDKASPRYSDVTSIDTVVKTSDSQVQIRLKQPYAPLLTVLSGAVGQMLSPTAVQKLGKTLGQAPVGVGTGPFLFGEWIKGDHLLLKANPNYWRKDDQGNALPYLANVRYRTITNGTVMYTNLQTAQINVATGVDPNDIANVKTNSALTYRQIAGPGFGSLFLNNAKAPLDNIHVRRAIAWGINRQEILDHVAHGLGIVAKGPLSPTSWAYDKGVQSYSYDPTKAKDELTQSGLSNVSFTMVTQSNSPTASQQAQFIQSQLQAIGITVNIKLETFVAEVQDVQTFNYQVAALGWTGGADPDGTMIPLFSTTGGFNYTKYSNPQVDTLLQQGRTTTDQAKRVTFYQQAQRLIVQDSPYIFITHPAVYQATTNNVKNYALYPGGVLDFGSVWLSS